MNKSRSRILVVDDNPTNLLLLCDLLEFEGYEVIQAADAASAQKAVVDRPPDLILMDVNLPDLDGLTLTRRLKSDPATQGIRIAVVTAAAMKGDEEKAYAAGSDAYISKPIVPSEVLQQVAALLGQAAPARMACVETGAEKLRPATTDSQAPSVLVVDDLPANRLLLREILEAERYRVLEAADGVEALSLIEHGGITAVISDVLMPNMDGFRLCLEVRKHPQFGGMPFVIYTSTYNSPADRALALKVGADRYLVKPAPREEILAALAGADEEAATRAPGAMMQPDEVGIIKQYNAALVAKLEEKNAELESTLIRLREQEARFRELAESINEVFWLSEPDKGRILYISPAYEAIWGRSCESLLSHPRTWLEAIHPDDRGRVQEAAMTKQTAGLYDEEYRVIRPDNSLRWIRDRAFPVRNAAGEIYRIAGVAADISGQKAARERIDEQAQLLDLTQDSISVRTLEDQIRYWNRASERLYGWGPSEVLGRPVREVLRPKPEYFTAAKEAVLAKGEWHGELEHTHRNGRVVVVDSRWTLLRDDTGQPKAVLVISTDITEKKQLAAQFYRAQRLESIGTLASGVAHDLNNILAPIIMAAPMLRWGLPQKQVEKLAETMETSAQRGAELVRQLLTFGRGAEGPRAVVQATSLLHEVIKIARQTFPKNIEFVSRIEPGLWPMLADPTQLHQVVLNLCVNARDAMPEGGRMTIGAKNQRIDHNFAAMTGEAKAGDYVVIEVEDTGTGIPPEIVDKIFDPFFTTKESGKGTGLGLATVLGIVKGHGGFVTLRTQVGEGTVFCISLPAALTAAVQEHGTASGEEAPSGNGEGILVVDDENNIRETIKGTLVQHGYKVITAIDGADGVAKFVEAAKQIQVVVTDLEMPAMDGLAMIQVLKRLNPAIAVVVSSGIASQAKMKHRAGELEKLGIHETLSKPYSAQKLLVAVHGALASVPKTL